MGQRFARQEAQATTKFLNAAKALREAQCQRIAKEFQRGKGIRLLHKPTGELVTLISYARDVAFITRDTPANGVVIPKSYLSPLPEEAVQHVFKVTGKSWKQWS